MAMLARVRALGVKGGPYYCAQGTAIDGLLARRRYKPLTLADPPFDPHLASDATGRDMAWQVSMPIRPPVYKYKLE